jgi:hypothetical protein
MNVNTSRLVWEELERHTIQSTGARVDVHRTYVLRRCKVPAGWLVQYTDLEHLVRAHEGIGESPAAVGVGGGITFVPDPTYAWLAS